MNIILASGIQHNDLIFVYTAKWSPQLSLVNIYHQTCYKFFFPCDENFQIYFLSNFQIYNTVLTLVTSLYITSPLLIYK